MKPGSAPRDIRWLFADQLGPHFLDGDEQRVLLIESQQVFRRRRFHRRKAHLILSALRHRAAELGERATLVQADTYAEALAHPEALEQAAPDRLSVCAPTSRAARGLVHRLEIEGLLDVLPSRGWAIDEDKFSRWAGRRGGKRLLMEDFYRDVRRHHELLLEPDGEPAGGRWNYDTENRDRPPKAPTLAASEQARGLPDPWWPEEDAIDREVRADLDAWAADGVHFLGEDGPRRFAVTRDEAVAALEHFVTTRLATFGRYEDAVLSGDRWMAHSLLSVPLNLGLLHPVEVARRAEQAYRDGDAELAAVEGFIRQVVGWREYVWHLYWHFGEDYRHSNGLDAHRPLPAWFAELDPDGEVDAACLADTLRVVREEGWTHHIPRLMILGNWTLQQGYDPEAVTDWFHRAFVDGYDWVMLPNVVGMATHADGGRMMTKPYAAGGAYINRMTDHCGDCVYDPKLRVGEKACPFTAGYWSFMHRQREQFEGNHRMRQAVRGLDRLSDLDALLAGEKARTARIP